MVTYKVELLPTNAVHASQRAKLLQNEPTAANFRLCDFLVRIRVGSRTGDSRQIQPFFLVRVLLNGRALPTLCFDLIRRPSERDGERQRRRQFCLGLNTCVWVFHPMDAVIGKEEDHE